MNNQLSNFCRSIVQFLSNLNTWIPIFIPNFRILPYFYYTWSMYLILIPINNVHSFFLVIPKLILFIPIFRQHPYFLLTILDHLVSYTHWRTLSPFQHTLPNWSLLYPFLYLTESLYLILETLYFTLYLEKKSQNGHLLLYIVSTIKTIKA